MQPARSNLLRITASTLLIALGVGCGPPDGTAPAAELSVAEILARTESTYASLADYEDRGRATLAIDSAAADRAQTETVRSSLVFHGPNAFRLTYRSSRSDHLVRRMETAFDYDGVPGPAVFDLTVELEPSTTVISSESALRADLWSLDD